MRTRIYKASIVKLLRKAEKSALSMYELAEHFEVDKGDPLLTRVIQKMEAEKTVERAMGQVKGMLCQMVFLKHAPPQMGRGRQKSMPDKEPDRETFDSPYLG